MSEPVYKFDIPEKFVCTLGSVKSIVIYPEKVMFDDKVIDYHCIDGVRPSKERDGFYVDLRDEKDNPFGTGNIFSCHIRTSHIFSKQKAKAYGMKIYSALFSAMSR